MPRLLHMSEATLPMGGVTTTRDAWSLQAYRDLGKWPHESAGSVRVWRMDMRAWHCVYMLGYIVQTIIMLAISASISPTVDPVFPTYMTHIALRQPDIVPRMVHFYTIPTIVLLLAFLVTEIAHHCYYCVWDRAYERFVASIDVGAIWHRLYNDIIAVPFLTCILIMMAGTCVFESMLWFALLMVASSVNRTSMYVINHEALRTPYQNTHHKICWYPLVASAFFGTFPVLVTLVLAVFGYTVHHERAETPIAYQYIRVSALTVRLLQHIWSVGVTWKQFRRRKCIRNSEMHNMRIRFIVNTVIVWMIWYMYYQ